MNTNGKFYIINERKDSIKAAFLTSLPVVWNRDGEYCIIPKAVVQNAIDVNAMYSKDVYSDKTTIPIVGLWWIEGIPISNLAGRALIGE